MSSSKREKDAGSENVELGKGMKFCTNCSDMDDLATDKRNAKYEKGKKRFHDCQETGNFEGDLCSRMFVLGNPEDQEDLFEDDDL